MFSLSCKHMAHKKRQELPISLYVVATPIGNLADLTDRAKTTLAQVDAVLCEDTRRTGVLMSALGIQKSLYRLDQHASDHVLEKAIEEMKAGRVFALVSDAGTPSVSDPGAKLVSRAHKMGLVVSPIPGPSALTSALSVSGIEASEFTFRGFFPRKNSDQEREWREVQNKKGVLVVWFESPERILDTFHFLERVAPEYEAFVAKELTKIHEWVYQSNVKNITSHIQKRSESGDERGEWVIGVKIPYPEHKTDAESDTDVDEGSAGWRLAIECLLNSGVSASSAARQVSQVFGVAKNKVYSVALERSKIIGVSDSE